MSGRRPRVSVQPGLSPGQRLAGLILRSLFRASARVTVDGGAELPRQGPLIVIGNHTSNADPPLVQAWLQGRLGRPIHFLAKEELFVAPLRPILRWYGAIPVRAGGSDAAAYRDGLTVLRGGGVLGIFPEGRRSADGRLGPARQGVALLAHRSGAPVLPVGISGLSAFLPRGAHLPRFGAPVHLRIGRPELLRLDPRLDRRAALAQATAVLMGRLAALIEPEPHGAGPSSRSGPA